jgi:hypothetical protein
MSKRTSPIADHKAGSGPKGLKLYTYGKVEFVLHPGGQPPRRFDINWIKEERPTDATDHEAANEGPSEGCGRG